MKSKVLITGGSGSVGKTDDPLFLGNGYEIINYDKVLGYDIFDKNQLMDSLKGVDVVIHLAAIPHPFLKGLTEDDYYRMNVDGSKAVIDAAIESKNKEIYFHLVWSNIWFLGWKVYTEKFPIDESNYIPSLEEGNSPYGISKVLVEKYPKEVSEQHKWFNTYCLRIRAPVRQEFV